MAAAAAERAANAEQAAQAGMTEGSGLRGRLAELEASLAAAMERASKAEQGSQAGVARLAELEASLAAAMERAANAEQATERVAAEVEASLAVEQERAAAVIVEAAGLRDRIVELEDSLAEANRRAADSASTTLQTMQRMLELESAVAKAADEAGSLRNRVATLEGALASAEQAARAIDTDLAAATEENARLVTRIDELTAAADTERDRCRRAIADTAEMEAQLHRERESAAEVMQLLSRVQERFSGAGRNGASADHGANGSNGALLAKVVAPTS
jgi:chromosome segregation ATPase